MRLWSITIEPAMHLCMVNSCIPTRTALAGSSEPDSGEGVSRHLVEIISLILLPLAMGMCGYALYVFVWRAKGIGKKRNTHFDDRYGPLALCGAVVVALVAIFLITCIDFAEVKGFEFEFRSITPHLAHACILPTLNLEGTSIVNNADVCIDIACVCVRVCVCVCVCVCVVCR